MRCNAEVEERTSVLIMQNTQTQHAYDMQLRNPIERYSFEGNEENGLESEHKRWQQQFMLKFDGKQSSSIGYLKPIHKIMYIDPNSML